MTLRRLLDWAFVLCALLGCGVAGQAASPTVSSREAYDAIYANAAGLHLIELLFDSQGRSRLATASAKDVDAVEAKLNAVAAFLSRHYATHRASIQRLAAAPLPELLPPINVAVRPDMDLAVLASQASQCTPSAANAELRVVFSLQAIDALLRGGLAAAYASPSHFKTLHASGEATAPADTELARRYLALGAALKAAKVELNPLQVSMLMTGFQQVEGHLEGALLFVMAHEIGHSVLHHHCLSCPPGEQTFQRRELQADFFAVTLTTSTMLEFIPEPWLQDSFDGSTSFIGSATFLQQGYERLLLSRPTRGGQCDAFPYPHSEERAQAATQAVQEVATLRDRDRQTTSQQSLEERIDSISRKYEERAKSGSTAR